MEAVQLISIRHLLDNGILKYGAEASPPLRYYCIIEALDTSLSIGGDCCPINDGWGGRAFHDP